MVTFLKSTSHWVTLPSEKPFIVKASSAVSDFSELLSKNAQRYGKLEGEANKAMLFLRFSATYRIIASRMSFQRKKRNGQGYLCKKNKSPGAC